MTLQDEFCAALDHHARPPRSDAIIVLRNWDKELTMQRIEKGWGLLAADAAPLLILPRALHTLDEAKRIRRLSEGQKWTAIILVTHRSHHYRAFLTFTKILNTYWNGIRVYTSCIDSEHDPNEFRKIEEYGSRGDISTYEEGLKILHDYQSPI